MFRIIISRVLLGVFTLFSVSVIIFIGTQLLPGDAAEIRLGQEVTDETLAAMRERLGLDLPAHQRYWNWLTGFLSGDLGMSLGGSTPVSTLIADRYWNTLVVGFLTAAIGVPVSLSLGILAAMFPGTLYDRILTLCSVSLVAVPEFFTATLIVIVLVLGLGIGSAVVVGSTDGMGVGELLLHFALPVTTLCCVIASQLIRMTRAAVLNVMHSPYIEMAVLKGVPRHRIVLHHALRNAIGPIANIVALNLAYLVTGVIVVEVYFAYSGLASLVVQGVQSRDYIVVQTVSMLFCGTYVVLMLLADLAATLSNPRLRHPR